MGVLDEIGLVFVRSDWRFTHFFEQVKIIWTSFSKFRFFLMLHILKFVFCF